VVEKTACRKSQAWIRHCVAKAVAKQNEFHRIIERVRIAAGEGPIFRERLLQRTGKSHDKGCKAAKRHKGRGIDTVEVETVADDIGACDLAAVVFALMIALSKDEGRIGRGPVIKPVKPICIFKG
jgi:hypothetical protein